MFAILRAKVVDNLQVVLVITMTIVILTCFSVDVLSSENPLSQQPQLTTKHSIISDVSQKPITPKLLTKYTGLQISIISDWGKREELSKTLRTTLPPPGLNQNIHQNPDNGIRNAHNGVANPPINPIRHPEPPVVTRGKAGISAQQAAKAKAYLQLKNMDIDSQLAKQQKVYYEEKYKISQYPELPFCVVVPSYKNVANNRYRQNMNSIIQQDYSNYRIIFIDDASEDDTGSYIKEYIKEKHLSDKKITVIINQERMMAMPNLHKAAHQFCKPHQIYMIVDGDDQLVGKQVFKHFNAIFSSQDVWVAYTNFISVRGSIGYSRPFSQTVMDKNTYRRSAFVISHLRAFYTKLFTNIKEEDLKDEQGNWYRAANDVAMYLPILEMSQKRVTYVPQISYMYNSNTGLNNHRVKLKEQKGNQRKIKTKPSYQALQKLFTTEELESLKENTGQEIELQEIKVTNEIQNDQNGSFQ